MLSGVNILLVYSLAPQKFRLSDSECYYGVLVPTSMTNGLLIGLISLTLNYYCADIAVASCNNDVFIVGKLHSLRKQIIEKSLIPHRLPINIESCSIHISLVDNREVINAHHGHHTNLVPSLSRALGAPHIPLAILSRRTLCYPQ